MQKIMVQCPQCTGQPSPKRKQCTTCTGSGKIEALFEPQDNLSYVDDAWLAIGLFQVRRVSVYITTEGDLVAKFDSQATKVRHIDAKAQGVNHIKVGRPPRGAIVFPEAQPWQVEQWLYDKCKDINKNAKVELMQHPPSGERSATAK